MAFAFSIIILFLISFFLAVRAVADETDVPQEVKNIKISKRTKLSGVILFLKEKIVHYSSESGSQSDP